MTAPLTSQPMLTASTVITGIAALRRTCLSMHAAAAQALGAGDLDIVGFEHVENGRRAATGSASAPGTARWSAPAGTCGSRWPSGPSPKPRIGNQRERQAEQHHQQRARSRTAAWRSQSCRRAGWRGRASESRPHRRPHRQRHGDQHRKDGAISKEIERHAQAVGDELRDRRLLHDRAAEIALQRIADKVQILLPERPVEAVFGMQPPPPSRARPGPWS